MTVFLGASSRAITEPSQLLAQWNRYSQDCSQSIGASIVQIREYTIGCTQACASQRAQEEWTIDMNGPGGQTDRQTVS